MTSVEIKGIAKSYRQGVPVLKPIDLAVEAGELFFLLGPSGCGKSTLLRILAGLVEPDSGSIRFDGVEITRLPPEKRRTAMVFQNYALWPHLSVYENVAFGLRSAGEKKAELDREVRAALELVRMGNRFVQYLLLAATVLFLGAFLLTPIYTVVEVGLDRRLLAEVFGNFIYREGLINSFAVAGVTTFLVFLIAFPLAMLYNRYEFPGKNLTHLLVMIPMILPPFVGALGFQQILGHYGVVNTILTSCGFGAVDFLGGRGRFWSVCLIEALHLYPILYLNLVTALGNLDPALDEAARNLGASRWTRFRRITFPLMKPGILAGGSIVLVWSFTELGTPLMFGYNRVTPVQIFNGIMSSSRRSPTSLPRCSTF